MDFHGWFAIFPPGGYDNTAILMADKVPHPWLWLAEAKFILAAVFF